MSSLIFQSKKRDSIDHQLSIDPCAMNMNTSATTEGFAVTSMDCVRGPSPPSSPPASGFTGGFAGVNIFSSFPAI
ncbi:hypothetical protein [Azonexus hydrophilus]